MKKYFIYLMLAAAPVLALTGCKNSDDGDDDPEVDVPTTPYAMVDLGLSVYWATYNVGAGAINEYGDYYAWGETEPKADYTSANYKLKDADGALLAPSCICGTEYDVAAVKWGGKWRMPTAAEFQELELKCSWLRTSMGDVGGWMVTGPNGNSIFFPSAGYYWGDEPDYFNSNGSYWSGDIMPSEIESAYYLVMGSRYRVDYTMRYGGQSVRAVWPKENK